VVWFITGPDQGRAGDEAGKVIFSNVCFTCHGTKGEGNAQLKAPSIAGLPGWYIEGQIANFQNDRRGFAPTDIEGQTMRAIAKTLDKDKVKAVAAFVEKLPRVTSAKTITADQTVGAQLFSERCMACHRYNGQGELYFGSPPLVSLQDWYLRDQLFKFVKQQRGVAPNDANGTKMSEASKFIEDEEALLSVVSYITSLAEAEKAKGSSHGENPFEKAETAKR
jgi:cbb3-type cytochrome c oxidase subunit III